MANKLGFDAVYMTGYGQSASHLGQPDVGLLTMTEMVARANAIVEAAGVPVLALGGPKTGIDGYFKFVQHCMQMGA